jgi:hypothetical protein
VVPLDVLEYYAVGTQWLRLDGIAGIVTPPSGGGGGTGGGGTPPPDTFVFGTTKPISTNCGLRDASLLTRLDGNQTITTPGYVLENKDIYGWVKIQAANVIVRNCRVRGVNDFGHLNADGTTTQGTDFLIDTRANSCKNALIEQCLLVPDYPSPWITGIIGHDYVASRVEVYHTNDGMGVYNTTDKNPDGTYRGGPSGVTIKGCYIHSLTFWTQAGTGLKVHPSDTKTHNDLIQQQGGTGTVIYGNNLQAFFSTTAGEQSYAQQGYTYGACNSAVQYNKSVGGTCGISATYNWVDGGGSAFNAAGGVPGIDVGEISNNIFGRKQIYYKGHSDLANDTYTIILTSTTTCITNNNVYDDGVPVVVRRNQ